MKIRLLLASNSTNSDYEAGYLDYCADEIEEFLGPVQSILLVPYALNDQDTFARRARNRFERMGVRLDSIHEASDPLQAVRQAEAIFVGGGNTFRLLRRLQQLDLLDAIRARVEQGMPYVGSSAGTILAGPSIRTTNDMPIVEPRGLTAMGVLPFNINPHYIDPLPEQYYHGESRELRLLEFLEENDVVAVALREGAMLRVEWPEITLKGPGGGRIFERGKPPREIPPGDSLTYLIEASAAPPVVSSRSEA